MNRIFNVVWSHTLGGWVVASEHAARRRRSGRLRLLAGTLALAPLSLPAADLPQDGRIVLGSGSIGSPADSSLQIRQSSQKLAIDWQSFDIGAGHSVTFQQPDSGAIALNRVIGSDGSAIHGRLEANGQVFLINPNGILFGRNASVNVGGLVASTLDLANEDFAAGHYRFRSDGNPAGVGNLGRISASDGGAVALLGGQVGNDGIIQARMGTVALAAGKQITLDFAGDGLLSVQIDEAAADALVDNGNLLKADGGTVLMTARASDALLQTVVNHDGIIEARTLASRGGKIVLQGGPDQGSVQVAGVLDASAPEGGDGGLIETGGATLRVADTAQVITASSAGRAGTWRVRSSGLTIGASSGSSISAAALSASLESGNVEVASTGSSAESGDIAVNDAVGWNAGTTLSLSVSDAISVNADITADGADAGLALNSGSDAGYRLRDGASITLSGSGARFSVNGEAYGVIQSLEALQGIGSDSGGRYVLGNDIDAGATGNWNDGAGFAPIGSGEQPFTGIFDGLGHTLSGLTINRTTSDPVGLFGATQGATIRQLGLSEISIAGLSHVGSLVGQARASTIESVHATGSVSGSQQVGGLVGDSNGLITASYHIGDVSGESQVGGLVGSNSGQVIGTFASGRVTGTGSDIGGLVGANAAGIVVANYSMGVVSGNTNVGGLAGANASGLIAANYSNAAVSGSTNVGGLVGLGAGGLVAAGGFGAGSLDEMAGLFGLDSSALLAGGYSIGNLAEIASGTGLSWLHEGLSFAGSYGLGDLQTLIGSRLAGAGYSLTELGESGLPEQAFDLGSDALARYADYANLFGSVSGYANIGGLVGFNADGIVAGSHSFGDVHGQTNVGGLVGSSSGLLIGNSASGTVLGEAVNTGGLVGLNAGTLKVSYAMGNVGGVNRVGGLAGYNTGSIDTSYAAGNVAIGAQSGSDAGGLAGTNAGSIASSFATGSVTNASSGTGGLVGSNSSSGIIADTYASGSVSGSSAVGGLVGANAGSVANSYAAGPVAGAGGNIGALLGYNNGGAANSYWDATAIAGLPGIGGGNATGVSGLGIDRMTQLDSFAGWSISASGSNAIWRIYEGQTKPLLRAFMTPLTVATEDASKTYDGTTWSGGSGYTPGSIRPNFWHRSVRVDDSLIQGAVNTSEPARNAGLYALDGGLYSGQLGYDLDYDAGTLTIHKASLTVSASPDSKGYDGTVTSSGTVGTSGLVADDTVIATQVFDSADIGERVLLVDRMTIADGNGGNNYEVTRLSASGAITAAPPRSDRPGSAADSRAVRASAAYLADLASNDPCKSASQQLSSAEASDCPAASTAMDRQEGSELSYRIENGGMRLPEGL